MYNVSARQIEPIHDTGYSDSNSDLNEFGVMITIKPPIELVPNAVRNYLMAHVLYDDDKHYTETGINEIRGVQLVGSTDEATSIYVAAIEGKGNGYVAEEIRADLAEHTVKLIGLLGSTATQTE